MNTSNLLQKLGGISALLEAAIYLTAFIIYGAVLVYPPAFLSDNQLILSVMNLVIYVLFGALLAVLVLALHERLLVSSPTLSKISTVFGLVWVGLVIASGMIANIGLNSVVSLGAKDPDQAMLIWSSIGIVTEGLGGGNEIVGGLWVLLLSLAALHGKSLSKVLAYLGIGVGMAGVLTIHPADIFTEIFGISQIIWFTWIGVFMIRNPINIGN
jgi:hypothetical protein